MTNDVLSTGERPAKAAKPWFTRLSLPNRIALAMAVGLVALAPLDPQQALESLVFVGNAMTSIAPVLAVSIFLAAAAKATEADALIAGAFEGRESRMIVLAALFGALSPFCSCGVVPVIAGLLGAGVPIAPVMAFWLSSPLMDPSMFVLTAANIGLDFAIAKTASAIGIGLFGGFAAMAADRAGWFDGALKIGAPKTCAAKKALKRAPPVWAFWRDPARSQTFVLESANAGWYLFKWLMLAFVLESLMLRYVPGEAIARHLGGDGPWAIPGAVLLGIPAYLNGYAAIPLVKGLIDLGMEPAVGLAFMLAGGVTSVPAIMAVWALVRLRLFAAYIGLAVAGATLAAYVFAAFNGLRLW